MSFPDEYPESFRDFVKNQADKEAVELLKKVNLGEMKFTEAVSQLRDSNPHLGLIRAKELLNKKKQKLINEWAWAKMSKEAINRSKCEGEGHDWKAWMAFDSVSSGSGIVWRCRREGCSAQVEETGDKIDAPELCEHVGHALVEMPMQIPGFNEWMLGYKQYECRRCGFKTRKDRREL
jgi:hypothetical protein